jgi:hypothetical protein
MKLLAKVLVASLVTTVSWAHPPDNITTTPESRAWYHSLQSPSTGLHCCDIADCRTTELRRSKTDATLWEAFISKEQFGPSAPDQWLAIPPAVILQHKTNPAGGPVICYYGDEIKCAVLPTMF